MVTTVKKNKDHSEALPSRRRLLKAIGGGTAAGATLLPGRWSKPVVDAVLLPAHAQTSRPCNVECDFRVRLSWEGSFQTAADLDLEIQTPGGTRVAPKAANGRLAGQCLQHEGDSVADPDTPGAFTVGAEQISSIDGSFVGAGRYLVFVRSNSVGGSSLRLSASVCGEQASCDGYIEDVFVATAGSINVSTGGTAVINFDCPQDI